MVERARQRAASPEGRARLAEQEREELRAKESKLVSALRDLESKLGARYSYQRASLDTFRAANAGQQKVANRLRVIRDDLTAFVSAGRSLIFAGSTGTGKDHLLAAMLYEATKLGVSCHWVDGLDFFAGFRDAIKTGVTEAAVVREFIAPQVLAISDPRRPSGETSDYSLDQLRRVIDKRNRALKPTWLTINIANIREAKTTLTPVIWGRLQEGAEIFGCFWESYREKPV